MDEEVRTRFGIILYLRFKDDIFVVLEAEDSLVQVFLEEFQTRAGDFVLKLESDSSCSVEMLDLTIHKGARWSASGVLDTTVYIKPTARGMFLSSESNHAPSVHSWPLERIKHFFKISSSVGSAKRVSRSFLARLLKHDPFHPVRHMAESSVRGLVQTVRCTSSKKRPATWLPLAFSPVWAQAGFSRTLESIHCELTTSQQENSLEFPSFGIAWALGGTHLYRRVQSMMRRKFA